ncbi:methyltransferase domain-containing protein [Jiangella anatolica]|uniref:Methyltransferase n=1 Tax=Jiangella anatolica TaxID=2670374 RepID=A0A2W2C472_9ACTN|nr:methyltransferase domain-containing protein [Jiangella anatolica]PZF80546.1 methyltransferase [Jiangella anatolica]
MTETTTFARVDEVPAGLRDAMTGYLERAATHPEIQRVRRVAQDALELRPGNRVLDAGCGLGEVARSLAVAVGARGEVDAVDTSRLLVDEASRRLRDDPLPVDRAAIRYTVGDVVDLPFDDATFDAVRCERVLQHLAEPDRAVAELVRVTAPGGRLTLVDTDWESLAFDGLPDELVGRLRRRLWHSPVMSGRSMGRTLRSRLIRAGAGEVRCEPVTLCFTGPEDAAGVVGFVEPGTLEMLLAAGAPVDPAADAVFAADWAAAVASAGSDLLTVLTIWVVTGLRG